MIDYESICVGVRKLVAETAEYIRTEKKTFRRDAVENKGWNDFVSYVDKTSEQKLVAGLKLILPEAGFIAEENTETKRGETYDWIVDPLDGTTNFIHSIPVFAISIALTKKEVPVVAVVLEINLDECFYTWEGAPSYLNGEEIKVTATHGLGNTLIATGFPYNDFGRQKEYMDLFIYLMHHTHGMRRLGSAATDLAYVAAGRFDAFYEYSLAPWDVAAGALLVKNAGGKVSDFSGGDNFIFGEEIIAANTGIYEEFLRIVDEKMNP